MLARNYEDIYQFPDTEFQQIVAGIRRLLPVDDALAMASAANNLRLLQDIDEGVVQLVKDCGKELTNTLGKQVRACLGQGTQESPLRSSLCAEQYCRRVPQLSGALQWLDRTQVYFPKTLP